MDGARFDHLTRTLARGASRRGLLKGLAAGLLGGVSGLRAADAAAQRPARQDNGEPCTRATECASFRCVDGVCCDTTCAGQCESCAGGVCQPVTGAPVGDRPACSGTDVCQATCDGVTPTHCAAYPGAEVVCADPVCEDVWFTTYGCAGNGSCHPTVTNCFPYRCTADGLACGESCTDDAECGDGAGCVNNQCSSELPIGEPCTVDAACASGHCVDEVCCAEVCGACQVCNAPGNEGFCGLAQDGGTCDADGGDTCCEGDCIDTDTDVEHCGECDHTCLGIANGRPVCVGGVCDIECLPDFQRCDVPETVCIPVTGCCTDLDCEAAAWCDIPTHACVADQPAGGDCTRTCPPELTAAEECAPDNMCLDGNCLDGSNVCGCTDDVHCAAETFCCRAGDVSAELCAGDQVNICLPDRLANEPCIRNEMCLLGICVLGGNVCGCAADTNCPVAFWCNTSTSICEPDRFYREPCERNEQCLSGLCSEVQVCGCTATIDCDDGEYCEQSDNICGVGCSDDTGCDQLQFCFNNVQCRGDREYGRICGRGAQCVSDICLQDGTCGCASDGECLDPSLVCDTGANVCVPGCTSAVDCGATEFCDTATGHCEAKQPFAGPCTEDSQCQSGACNTNRLSCGCIHNSDCPAEAPLCESGRKACIPITEECVDDDGDCSPGQWCGPSNLCHPDRPYGEACDRGAQCNSDVCLADNTCGCDDTGQCPTGKTCFDNICVCSTLLLTASGNPTDGLDADNTIRVTHNGTVIATESGFGISPIEIPNGKPGDTLQIEGIDNGGVRYHLSPLYLVCFETLETQVLNADVQLECCNAPDLEGGAFYDDTFTIEI